jgi:hypothetical protein
VPHARHSICARDRGRLLDARRLARDERGLRDGPSQQLVHVAAGMRVAVAAALPFSQITLRTTDGR